MCQRKINWPMNQTTNQYVLDLVSEQLLIGETKVDMPPKVFELLVYLINHPDVLIKSQDIRKALWPNTYVSKSLVREYIHDLRQALNDDAKNPNYIETIHARGYRYLGGIEVKKVAFPDPNIQRTRVRSPIIAVLPVKLLSDNKTWEHFADGITDDIITDLTRFSDLGVIAYHSTAKYKDQNTDVRQIATDLNADYILEGSIHIIGTKLRFTSQLIKAEDATHLWAERFDKDSEDLFKIKDEIVQQVSAAIGGFGGAINRTERNIILSKPPSNLEIYKMYLHGYELEEQFTKQSNREAIKVLERVVELDPSFARPWLILGWAYYFAEQYQWAENPEFLKSRQNECYKKAVELDSRDPLILKEIGVSQAEEGQVEDAIRNFKKAFYLGKNYADVLISLSTYYVTVIDDNNTAKQMIDDAMRLNPNTPQWYYMHIVRVFYFTGQFEKTILAAKNSVQDFPQTLYLTAFSLAQLGRLKEAEKAKTKFNQLYPDFDFKEEEKIHSFNPQ